MLGGFTFNGKSSNQFGLLVTALNPYNAPSRKVDKISIPYRNGDIILDTNSYNNIQVSYEISLINKTKENAKAIRNWLLDSIGYHQLKDTYNNESYRIGCIYNNIEYILTALYRYGTSTITFDCIPQRYLNENETISVPAGTTTITAEYHNEPIINVGTPGTIRINGQSIVVNDAPVVINTQTMQCYYEGTNMNQSVELDEFPIFNIGENTIETDVALTIVPNWWIL